MRILVTLTAALFLAACTGAPARQDRITPAPDLKGLGIVGSDQRLDFGRAPEGVITALNRSYRRSKVRDLAGCPADIRQQIAWGDLILTFTDEAFVGWRVGNTFAGTVCIDPAA
ncbi:MAG TPA: hypothetical protein ENJ52_00905 [Aliiroseovarius sp.]|nr:hypothetical protein [Aliiroseovarius sp.]